jgi:hypothetical protein
LLFDSEYLSRRTTLLRTCKASRWVDGHAPRRVRQSLRRRTAAAAPGEAVPNASARGLWHSLSG